MNSYSSLFGNVSKETDPLSDIKIWLNVHSDIKTKANRINYIINGLSPYKINANDISNIGLVQVGEATEANRYIDSAVNYFAEMKDALKPAETLILEALQLIEGVDKVKGVRGFLMSFKTALNPSPEEVRNRVKAKIENAIQQFDIKIPIRVEDFIQTLDKIKIDLGKILIGLDSVIDSLNYLLDQVQDATIKDLLIRRKEMFAKSNALMCINMEQVDAMHKICEQKKLFVEELKMNVVPVIDAMMRSSVIKSNDDLSSISEALRRIL